MPVSLARKTLKEIRIIHGVFLLSTLLYIAVPIFAFKGRPRALPPIFPLGLGIVALGNLGIASYLRSCQLTPSSEALRNNQEDAAAAKQWRSGTIVSLVFCETIILFGLALRIKGVPWSVCGIFYAVGILFMLAWTPKLDLPPE